MVLEIKSVMLPFLSQIISQRVFDRSTDNQFLQFLDYAKASCGEVKSMLYLASKLNFINDEKSSELLKSCDEESRILYALMQKIRNDKTVQ